MVPPARDAIPDWQDHARPDDAADRGGDLRLN
jgi:hypothetical protein